MRYAWDLQFQCLQGGKLEYSYDNHESGVKSLLARWVLHKMQLWDSRTSHGVDHYVANSAFIAQRIKKVYGRSATVIYPQVDTDHFTLE